MDNEQTNMAAVIPTAGQVVQGEDTENVVAIHEMRKLPLPKIIEAMDHLNEIPLITNSPVDAIEIEEEDVSKISSTPQKIKQVTKRTTPLGRRTRNGRATKQVQQCSGIEKDEVVILRAENAVLKNAVNNLERTIDEQKRELTEFRADLQFLKLELKKSSENNAANERKFSILQEEQEKRFEAKLQSVSAQTRKQMDKISTKCDQALKCSEAFSFSKAAANNIKDSNDNDANGKTNTAEVKKLIEGEISKVTSTWEERIHNVETDLERLEHVQASTIQVLSPSFPNEIQFYTPKPKRNPNPGSNNINGDGPNVNDNIFVGKDMNSVDNRVANNKSAGDISGKSSSLSDLPVGNHDRKAPRNNKRPLTKTLIIMDSNAKYLTDDIWKNSVRIFSPTAQQLITRLPHLLDQHKPDLVMIHNGTNDLDNMDGAAVARNLLQIAQEVKRTSQIKVIISEIPPRKSKDEQVELCNEHLHTYFDPMEGVIMASHTNLRSEDWQFYEDDKHLKQDSIAKFASNLKTALREALGIKLRSKVSAKRKDNN